MWGAWPGHAPVRLAGMGQFDRAKFAVLAELERDLPVPPFSQPPLAAETRKDGAAPGFRGGAPLWVMLEAALGT